MARTDWDVIVVGGGPAGLSTALHLRARSPDLAGGTLVLEKERHPREKYCAGGLGMRALRQLAALDVRPDVPMVPIRRVEMRTPRYALPIDEPDFGGVVRRAEFDAFLAGEVRARGVALREEAAVREVRRVGGGVEVVLADGETLRARAVVGADGVGGVVRRSIGLPAGTLRASVLELDTEPVASDRPRDTLVFEASWPDVQGYTWDFPTLVDGREMVCRGVYVVPALGPQNLRERLGAWLAAKGLDIRRYRLKPFGERGAAPGEPMGKERVLLAGEAAGIDIATGEGIAQAVAYGALAADELADGFARGDLSFAGWTRRVWASGLGRGLLGRLVMFHAFYGHPRKRAFVEGLLRHDPAILQAYAQGFSRGTTRLRTAARMAARFPYAAARAAVEAR